MNKISAEHLNRSAVVYIRQSTAVQLKLNTESRRRQYGLQERARALGWSEVIVIDADGVYDPRLPNERLLLGMKGTMSELELSLLRQRSHEAVKLKASRGELFTSVPVGYVRTEPDRIEKDPDERVRAALDLVFRKFMELQSVRQVHLWLREERVDLPFVDYVDSVRVVRWRPPVYSTVLRVLRNPTYAGAYAYGQRGSATRIEAARKKVRRSIARPMHEWEVLLKDQHEGYICWATFEQHQRIIMHNNTSRGGAVRGAIRRGEALLAGLLRCAHCGRRLQVRYGGVDGSVIRYHCRSALFRDGPGNECISFGALPWKPPRRSQASVMIVAINWRSHWLRRSSKPLAPSASTTRSIPSTAWWQPSWSDAGMRGLPIPGASRSASGFLTANRMDA